MLLWAACAYERPIHPMRLDGYPGAPIESNLFPLRDGMRWVFVDRLDPTGKPLRLEVRRKGKGFVLAGATEEEAEIGHKDGFLEIRYGGKLTERPLKLQGRVGDTWRAGKAVCTAFGYDLIEVDGKALRTLVVAVEHAARRDLYWFAPNMGFVRIRTEREGRVVRDARLVEHAAGSAN